jgi:proton-dependent oligopeptide transporter, POT family
MSTAHAVPPELPTGAGSFSGHPKGLAYLAFTELWERFSYYGMTALLALYLGKQLLLPGHAEHVLGLAGLRHLFEFRAPMSNAAFASLIYGWYGGLVYFTPIVGGWVADRWLGAKRTVTAGALLMSGGHLAMTFDQSFLIALGLLILGSGFLKGNISAQVGALYPRAAESLRARGFTIFSTAINIGGVLGPLGTGAVAAVYGWHAGFGLAAVLMLLALAIYLAGQRHLPDSKVTRDTRSDLPPLTREEKRRTLAIVGVIVLTVFPAIAYPMIWNIGIIWIDQHVDLWTPLGTVPASWFNSVDAFASIVIAVPLIALWAWQARRKQEPGDLTKIAIGSALVGASALLLAAGSALADEGAKVPVWWALACYFGMGTAFMWYWPQTLALVSQSAPAKINATMVSASFLALFVGITLMGWVGSFYDQMSPAAFWTVDAAIGFCGALIAFAVRRPLMRLLEPHGDASGAPGPMTLEVER